MNKEVEVESRTEIYRNVLPAIISMEGLFNVLLQDTEAERTEIKKKLSRFKILNPRKDPEIVDINNEIEVLEMTVSHVTEIIENLEACIK